MGFCLIPSLADKFKKLITSGEIDVIKLGDLPSSAARRDFLANHFDKSTAKEINTLFEKQLLLKNQEQAMINFIKQATGMSEPVKRDMLTKISKMKDVMNPTSLKNFKEDLVNSRLGTNTTIDEIKELSAQVKGIMEVKTKADSIVKEKGIDIKKWTKEDKLVGTEYGLKLAIYKDYLASLKPGMEKTGFWKGLVNGVKDWKNLPIAIGNLTKSIVASFDNSFWLNQGINALFDPKTTKSWGSAFAKSFKDMVKALGGADPVLGIKGEIYGRPLSLNGAYEKAKLSIGLDTEEAIPTTATEKIPFLGRLFRASNAAYNGAALRLRADIFDMRYAQNVKNGIDMTDKFNLESLGQTVNSFTGRGDTGLLTGEKVNALIFSVKFAKSKFDVMTAHLFSKKVSTADKKQAAYSLVRMTMAAGSLFAISETLNPGSTELDPRATNFGKIKIGNKWYSTPVSFGGLPNLIARTLIPTTHNGEWGLWMKNQTGDWRNLLSGDYGSLTANDIMTGYFEGKSAPIVRALLDTWAGKDMRGNKSTPLNVGKNLIQPISVGNIKETLKDKDEDYKAFSILMQFLGANTSSPQLKKEDTNKLTGSSSTNKLKGSGSNNKLKPSSTKNKLKN